jgi:integrase
MPENMLAKPDYIIKQNTRILRPSEYRAFREQLNPVHQTLCDVALNTGMRWVELWQFVKHPEWYRASRRCIELPLGSIKKVRCLHKERTIHLTANGCKAVEILIGLKLKAPIERSNFHVSLRLAASKSIGEDGITPKMFRKTLVSWLIKCMPEKALEISASMGHNLETMRVHYLGIAFERQDVEEMREYLKGWGGE